MNICKMLLSILFSIPMMTYSMEKKVFDLNRPQKPTQNKLKEIYRTNTHTQPNHSGPIENEIDDIKLTMVDKDCECYQTLLKNGDHLTARYSPAEGINVFRFSHGDMIQDDKSLFWVLKRIFKQSE